MTPTHRSHVPVMFWNYFWSFFGGPTKQQCSPSPLINRLLQAALADRELKPVIKKKAGVRQFSHGNSLEVQQPLGADKMKQRRRGGGMKKQHSHGEELKQSLPPSSQRRRLRNPSKPMRRVIQSDVRLVSLQKVPESIWFRGSSHSTEAWSRYRCARGQWSGAKEYAGFFRYFSGARRQHRACFSRRGGNKRNAACPRESLGAALLFFPSSCL